MSSLCVPEGFYVEYNFCGEISSEASSDMIGAQVVAALEAFQSNQPLPSDFRQLRKAHLRRLGFSSERQLQQNALYCSFSRNSDSITFEPTHNGGTAGDSKGFQPNGTTFTISGNSNVADIGNGLRKAFSLCTSIYNDRENQL